MDILVYYIYPLHLSASSFSQRKPEVNSIEIQLLVLDAVLSLLLLLDALRMRQE